jgi:uncharacterized protein (DUF2062 family)
VQLVRWVIHWSPVEKVRRALFGFLASGSSSEKLALGIAVGSTCGLFPVFGTTTALAALTGVIFRVNPVVVQIANYSMYPLYFPCMLGFLVAGASVFRGGGAAHGMQELEIAFRAGWVPSIRMLGWDLLYAVIVWAVLAPVLVLLLRLGALRLIKRWRHERDVQSESAPNA